MAAQLIEFQPMPERFATVCREIDGKHAAVELVMVLLGGCGPMFNDAGQCIGYSSAEPLYLCAEGRDLLQSIRAYLLWRAQSLTRELGHEIVSYRLQQDLDPLIG